MTERKSTFASYQASPRPSFKHSTYFPVYDRLFSPWVGRAFTFVEVGVFGGGSLLMWRDYFGPDARIIGIDFNPEARRLEADGFEIFIGNQADPEFWQRVMAEIGPVDVVLDDGGHTYEQQIVTVASVLPAVRDGGLIVVEDTHTSYQVDFGGPSNRSFVGWAKTIANGINHRYSGLADRPRETTIFSVAFYESIVAFEIDRALAGAPSIPTQNMALDAPVRDYRYADFRLVSLLKRKGVKLNRAHAVPVIGGFLSWVLKGLFGLRNGLRSARLGRYFRY